MMGTQTFVHGLVWAAMGLGGIALVETNVPMDRRVKWVLELAIGAAALTGAANIWGLLN